MKKPIALLLFAGGLCLAAAQLPLNIAVLDLNAKGVDSVEASVLSEKLRGEFINIGRFQVIERGAVEAILKEQGFQQSGCTSNECVAQAGQILGVQYVAAGSIGKIEKTFLLSVRLISASSGKIDVSAEKDIAGSMVDVMKTGVPDVVRSICSRLDEKDKPLALFAPRPDTVKTAAAPSKKEAARQAPSRDTGKKKRMRFGVSFAGSAGQAVLEPSDSAALPDTTLFRTSGVDLTVALSLGRNSLGARLTLNSSPSVILEQSQHEFQRILAGGSLEWYYEGFSFSRETVVLAPGLAAGFWKISDKGKYHDYPGKETTLDFTRFLSPLLKLQIGNARLKFAIEYALLLGTKSVADEVRWVHDDGSSDYFDKKYSVGAVHKLSAGFLFCR